MSAGRFLSRPAAGRGAEIVKRRIAPARPKTRAEKRLQTPLSGDTLEKRKRYARAASGNVYGFVQGANPGSIFNTVEYPTLLKNSDITNILTELFH